MTFVGSETSIDAAQPIEGYKFVGSFTTYRYTSADVDVTINGELYLAIPMDRTEAGAGTQNEDNTTLEIEVPNDLDIIQDYAFGVPPQDLQLTVYRSHRDLNTAVEFVVYWSGRVSGFNVGRNTAKIQIPSILSLLLNSELPTVYFQNVCNNVLYDARCGVSLVGNEVVTTISSIDENNLTIASDGGKAAGFFKGGQAINTTLVPNERRMIVSHTGTAIGLAFPFSAGAAVGNGIKVQAGCNHQYEGDCGTKFTNKQQFNGFPYSPSDNPFEGTV
jgi:uncharacterized phage protein (TIGR02218 family)